MKQVKKEITPFSVLQIAESNELSNQKHEGEKTPSPPCVKK
jgi:hypothetical protein